MEVLKNPDLTEEQYNVINEQIQKLVAENTSSSPPEVIGTTEDTIYYANSLGEGGILVSNYTGEIQNGDYITTSPITGYGALQADDLMHSYTVAKCTQNIDWTSVTNTIDYNGVSYKYLIVACTYHCG